MCPTDGDGDGYGATPAPGCPARQDCDDAEDDTNPGELEWLHDAADENCNGRNGMLVTLSELAFSPTQWAESGPISHSLDAVSLGTVASSVAASTTRTLSMPLNTSVVVALDVASNVGSGAACEVRLGTAATAPASPTIWASRSVGASGTQILSFEGLFAPGRILKKIQLACYGNRLLSVDWLQIQDADVIFPPPKELSFAWQDTRHPVGGGNTVLSRDDQNGRMYMGSDVAGVGMYQWGPGWRPNGAGASSLMAGGMLGIGDILPIEAPTGEVYVLTGDVDDFGTHGGFWYSSDYGSHWAQLGSSLYEYPQVLAPADTTFVTHTDDVAGYPLETNCTGSHAGRAWDAAGGRSLVADSLTPATGDVIYIANNDKEAMGVSIWDQTSFCPLPNRGDALPADRVGALLRVDALPAATPVLVVGYRARVNAGASVYVCELPASGLLCSDTDPDDWADCQEITGDLAGADVRDLEWDTWLADIAEATDETGVLLVDGGNRPDDYVHVDENGVTVAVDGIGDDYCNGDEAGLWELKIADDGTGVVVTVDPVLALADDFGDDGLFGHEITGASLDPTADFVFVNVPVTASSAYAFDRMYRIPAADLLDPAGPSGTWEAVNSGESVNYWEEDHYEAVRATYDLELAGAWPEITFNGRADPFPARNAPGAGYDTIWSWNWPFGGDFAVIAGGSPVWFTTGLTDMWTQNEFDADGLAEPEGDVKMDFWPNIDTSLHQTYQSTVVTEAAIARDGHIWTGMMDQGLAHLDATVVSTAAAPYGSEVDCLWHGWHAAASSVSVVDSVNDENFDPVVWATLLDEGSPSNPQRMGVIRTSDNGGTWQYAAAGWLEEGGAAVMSVSAVPFGDPAYGYRLCMDNDLTHVAAPFDVTDGTAIFPAHAFSVVGASAPPLDQQSMLVDGLSTSIGNPAHIRALNDRAALVLFRPPTQAGAPGQGGLYLTVDGGGTWERLDYDDDPDDPDFDEANDGDPGTPDDGCDEAAVLAGASFEFIHVGTDTYWEGDPLDPTLMAELSLDILVSVRQANVDAADSRCSLARVQVQASSAAATATTWSWYTLPFNSGKAREINGGACLMDLDQPDLKTTAGSLTMVLDPRQYAAGISVVAPHPQVADVWAILPELSSTTWDTCTVVNDGADTAWGNTNAGLTCPYPYPMIMQGNQYGWQITTMNTAYPNTKPLSASWSELGVPDDSADGEGSWLVVGTGGSGAWRGEMGW